MKDSITNSIIQRMLSVLDNAQLKQLKKAIEATLADYEIVKCDENKQPFGALRKQENQAVFGQYQCGKPRKQ